MMQTLRRHWPEYLMEAAALGSFMVSACLFGALLGYPGSPVYRAIPDAHLRRVLGGLAMGLTAILIIRSPWGMQSGAHMNPATTLTFLRLGKIDRRDALFYVLAQCAGGAGGVLLASAVFDAVRDPSVNYVVTVPGPSGAAVAFAAEMAISFGLMSVVLRVSNSGRLSRFTPFFVGALVATYISIEAPLSGMSMNPARTLSSALNAGVWTAWWIYFTAPLAGMLAAAEVYVRRQGLHRVFCAKMHHHNSRRCIFRCNFGSMAIE
jgi:aquaporin Z